MKTALKWVGIGLVGLVVLVAAVPTGASAQPPGPLDGLNAKRSARALQAAQGEYVPCSGVHLAWVPVRTVRQAIGHGTLAAVLDGGCTVYYNKAVGWWSPQAVLRVTVHRYGPM